MSAFRSSARRIGLGWQRPEGDDVRCDVVVNVSDGREAVGWFTYAGEPPPSCAILRDFSQIDWESIPELMALYVCLWPVALAAIVAFSTLRCAWASRRRSRHLQRVKDAGMARASSERRVREEPL